MKEPTRLQIAAIQFVGLSVDHNVHQSAEGADTVPALWAQFAARSSEVGHSLGRYLGVGGPVLEGGQSFYVAALEVSQTVEVPHNMVAGVIPAGTYVRFLHEGSIDQVWKTVDFIHNTWIANAGFTNHDCRQIELYTWGTEVHAPNFKLEILVPLEER